jgi:PhnB protein
MFVQPYLNFDGRCDEALEFYRTAVGAEVQFLMRFKDSPDQTNISPASAEKVMHCSFRVGDSVINASDGHCMNQKKFDGVSLSLSVDTVEQAERYFAALGAGGRVDMPMTQTFFSPRFGMLVDRFGLCWMVLVRPENA